MRKNLKGDGRMTTLNLKDIESRVHKNSTQNKDTTTKVIFQIKSKNLKLGRVRPKNPVETKILSRFTRR